MSVILSNFLTIVQDMLFTGHCKDEIYDSEGIFPPTALSILGICQSIDSPMSRLM